MRRKATLHALAVIDLRQKRPEVELEAERRRTWQMLRGLEPAAARAGVTVEVHLAEGVPAEQIVLQAESSMQTLSCSGIANVRRL